MGTDTAIAHVVRVRETQEYDVEVTTSGGCRGAVMLARRRFMSMTAEDLAANSVGVTERGFEVEGEAFDEDELAAEANA